MTQWAIVTEDFQVTGPYRAYGKAKGVYDELRGYDVPCHLIELKPWWLIESEGSTVEDMIRAFGD